MKKKIGGDTLLDLLFRAAKSDPSKIYCKSVDHQFTYQQFISAIVKLSSEISGKKLKNDWVGVLLPNSILFLIAYFAVLMSGNIPVLLNFMLPESALGKLLDDLQSPLILSNKDLSYPFLFENLEKIVAGS